ncbi:hypothetical protein BDP27DRAFT_1236199, partial [Rhodocollybia butyracea]
KLEVREQKRNALPSNSEHKSNKYDAAFAYQLMLEDKDEKNTEPGRSKRFISQPPTYRLNEMQSLFSAVDTVADPKPSTQYVPCVLGDPKEVPLPATRTLVGRVQMWTVKLDWLNNHPESNNPNCIADSGRLWGDERDPEEVKEMSSTNKKEKKAKNTVKRELKRKAADEGNAGASTLKGKGKELKRAKK